MALNSGETRYEGLTAMNELESGYYTSVERLLKTPILPECSKCTLYRKGLCQAACYAFL
jgi:hypothetical protein